MMKLWNLYTSTCILHNKVECLVSFYDLIELHCKITTHISTPTLQKPFKFDNLLFNGCYLSSTWITTEPWQVFEAFSRDKKVLRESSFNMTRGGMKILRGALKKLGGGKGLQNFLCFKINRRGGGGAPKNWTASEGGC